jgi:hypothetical protein
LRHDGADSFEPENLGKPAKNRWTSENSRDNKTAIELFLAGVAQWEPHILRLVEAA